MKNIKIKLADPLIFGNVFKDFTAAGGGLLGRIVNTLFPGVAPAAALEHDRYFNTGGPLEDYTGGPLEDYDVTNPFVNYGTMIPAAIVSTAAVIGNYSRRLQENSSSRYEVYGRRWD